MANHTSTTLSLLFTFLLIAGVVFHYADGEGKRRIHITDELDDVVDDEEDEAWKEWGKKSAPEIKFDPPPSDFSNMDLSEIQAEMMKRQAGPAFGFVKLRLGDRRTPDMVSDMAMRWTKISRTGAIDAKFMGVDISTIMFTLEKGQDTLELKEFLLNQPEAYEVKIGDQLFRRPGDPPFEDVFEKLHGKESGEDNSSPSEGSWHQKDEL